MVDVMCETLEAAFHLILYVRGVYPQCSSPAFPRLSVLTPLVAIFQRVQKYGMPVHQARHPDVQSYISDVIVSLRPWLLKRVLQRVAFVICSDVMTPLERFVFEIAPGDPHRLLDADYVQAYMRSFFLKINTVDASMPPNTAGTTFSVVCYTASDAQEAAGPEEMLVWEPVDDASVAPSDGRIVPLKSMNEGAMKIQLYVERPAE